MNAAPAPGLLRRIGPSRLTRRLVHTLHDRRLRIRFEAGAVIGLAVGLTCSVALFFGILGPLDPLLSDLVYQPIPPTGRAIVISIDEKSVEEIGRWPWPRTVFAGLLDRLRSARPRVIAIDLPLSQSTDQDGEFATAIRRSGNVLLCTSSPEAGLAASQANGLPKPAGGATPTMTLALSAAGLGHCALTPDPDGVLRRMPAAVRVTGVQIPALGLAAANSYLRLTPMTYDLPQRRVLLGTTEIQTDEGGRMLLKFTSTRGGVETVPFSDVLSGRIPDAEFTDKIVMIGGTRAIGQPEYATPVASGNNSVPGVEIEAGVAEMLLATPPRLLQRDDSLYQLAAILLVALVGGLTLPHLRPLSAAALTLLYFLVLAITAYQAFGNGLVIRIAYPGLALILTFGAVAIFRYLSEERRRQFLTVLFRRYVPPESVAHVVEAADRGEVPLSGSRRKVTVLYADLRGFSGLSEGLEPEAVLELVNGYLELLLQEIHLENGTVNKPMGDALIAVWNAPLDQPDHGPRALRACINIRKGVLRYEAGRTEQHAINIGMGLATGYAVFGNIHALGKVEYTLVGETVNIASRISAFAGKNQILADTETAQTIPDGMSKRELSPVRIRGRKDPLPVWEVNDTVEPAGEDEEEWPG